MVLPVRDRGIDVSLLSSLVAAGQKKHDFPAVIGETYPVSWAEVDGKLVNASANGFGGGDVAQSQAVGRADDAGSGGLIQATIPGLDRALAGGVAAGWDLRRTADTALG